MNLAQPLTNELLKTFKLAKVFKQGTDKPIVSMDFDDSGTYTHATADNAGEYCVTANEDESIVLYDCMQGKDLKWRERLKVYSKKYGVHHVKFAHSNTNIIHASTKEDDTIRYLSLHDNRYLRYFKGHKSRVVSLDMSPVDDTFISGALDDTVRIWDLRSPACQVLNGGVTNIKGHPCVAVDPKGVIFAVGLNNNSIRLYDLRNYEQGPFGIIPGADAPKFFGNDTWTSIKFSNNEHDMIVTTRQGKIYVVNTYEFKLKYVIGGIPNSSGLHIDASFSPDAKYIASGSEDGTVHIYDAANGNKVTELLGHSSPTSIVQFNPKKLMIVSADSQMNADFRGCGFQHSTGGAEPLVKNVDN